MKAWSSTHFLFGLLVIFSQGCNQESEIQMQEEDVPASTEFIVNHSSTCEKDTLNGDAKCILKIGNDLELEISAIQTRRATIFINKAKMPEEADYYMAVIPRSHCVRIDTGGKIDSAIDPDSDGAMEFILDESSAWLSPYDAKAYSMSVDCEESAEKFLMESSL